MKCECQNWTRVEGADLFLPDAHHSRCPKFETEVRGRLFYFEEAEDAWVPAPDKVESIIDADSHFGQAGETFEITFKRVDMTDKELFELPET